jgi:hypothetical protein
MFGDFVDHLHYFSTPDSPTHTKKIKKIAHFCLAFSFEGWLVCVSLNDSHILREDWKTAQLRKGNEKLTRENGWGDHQFPLFGREENSAERKGVCGSILYWAHKNFSPKWRKTE